jgi:hypothetical protein
LYKQAAEQLFVLELYPAGKKLPDQNLMRMYLKELKE